MKKIKNIFNNIVKSIQNLLSKKPKINKAGIIIIAVAFVVGLAFYFKGLFIVALVNGQPVTRLSMIEKLEKRDGKQVLENVVTEMLIEQEANKMKVVVKPEETAQELDKIRQNVKDSNQDLDQLLSMQGMTMEDLTKQIQLQIKIEKILGDKVNPTDEEVNKYIEENKDSFPETFDADQMKDTIKLELKQQKLSTEFTKWLDMVKTKSNINYIVKYL